MLHVEGNLLDGFTAQSHTTHNVFDCIMLYIWSVFHYHMDPITLHTDVYDSESHQQCAELCLFTLLQLKQGFLGVLKVTVRTTDCCLYDIIVSRRPL